MIELYHNAMSTCSQKARMALAEKGVAWEGHLLDLRAGDQFKPDFRKINPKAVVPVLVHDGRIIPESTVICEYIDDSFRGPMLRPKDRFARAKMRLWTKQLDEGLHLATAAISFAIAFRHQLAAKLDSPEKVAAHFDAVPNPASRAIQRDAFKQGLKSRHFADAVRAFDKLVGDMDAALADGPWLTGQEFSLADIGYAPYAVRLDHLQLAELWRARRRFADWYTRIQARPGFEEGIERWFVAPYVDTLKQHGKDAWPGVKQLLAA